DAGQASAETGEACGRAVELCRRADDEAPLAEALWGLWAHRLFACDLAGALPLAEEGVELARRRGAAAIEGYVTPSDRDAWPRIFDWYGAFGFQKVDTPPPPFLPPGTVTIRLELAGRGGSGAGTKNNVSEHGGIG
ncbi:MAG TPA: hypothetical protein VER55_13810, partial [Ardenticatenaceae bacterium]|nr:hypothetical protein [Ardenticatenaceae bacterium]